MSSYNAAVQIFPFREKYSWISSFYGNLPTISFRKVLINNHNYGIIIKYCKDIPLQQKNRIKGENRIMKLVVTIFGKDQVGIIANVSNILAAKKVNITSVNQNIVDGFFNMIMMAELTDSSVKLADIQKELKEKGHEMNLEIKVQNQEIFNIMHNV